MVRPLVVEGASPNFLTVKEVCEILRFRERAVRDMIRRREIRAIKLRGRYLIPSANVWSFIKKLEQIAS